MSELLAGTVGFLIGVTATKLQAARNRFARDLAYTRSLPEPPSHCRLIDDDTDGPNPVTNLTRALRASHKRGRSNRREV